jgi:cytochrome c553
MKRTSIVAGVAVITLTVGVAGAFATRAAGRAKVSADRGRYLVSIMGCHDCHTPFKMGPNGAEPDMSRALTGHPEGVALTEPPELGGAWLSAGSATNTAFVGPWGMSFAANLTPDQNTGLGIWTEDMFVRAIRTGRHMGASRPIMPPMPWPVFRNASDEDLKSIFAYLRTLPPVTNHVPAYQEPQVARR